MCRMICDVIIPGSDILSKRVAVKPHASATGSIMYLRTWFDRLRISLFSLPIGAITKQIGFLAVCNPRCNSDRSIVIVSHNCGSRRVDATPPQPHHVRTASNQPDGPARDIRQRRNRPLFEQFLRPFLVASRRYGSTATYREMV